MPSIVLDSCAILVAANPLPINSNHAQGLNKSTIGKSRCLVAWELRIKLLPSTEGKNRASNLQDQTIERGFRTN
jgi:hypothetical protein